MAMASAQAPEAPPQQGPGLRQKHMNQLVKTELCKFFLRNACGKGKNCHFAHSLHEIREKPDLTRTSMCQTFLATGSCDNPRCQFAHSEKSLRCTSGFFKTKVCRFASNGRCKHGAACRFAHTQDELSDMVIKEEEDLEVSSGQGSTLAPPSSASAGSGTPPISSEGHSTPPDQRSLDTAEQHGYEEPGVEYVRPNLKMQKQVKKTEKGAKPVEEDKNQAKTTRHCTTIMLTNVPTFLTQGALLSLLEDKTPGLSGNYDFFYCPWNPAEECNLGYAIINFLSRSFGATFEKQWADQCLVPRTRGCRNLRILPAALQGRAANLRHFSGFALAMHENPRFRPLVRAGPDQPLRPMTTRVEAAPEEEPQQQLKQAPFQAQPQHLAQELLRQQQYDQQYLLWQLRAQQLQQVNGGRFVQLPETLLRGYPQEDLDPLDLYAAMGNGCGAFGA